MRVGKFLAENERLLVVAASTVIMSLSHTALRPVLPVFAKVVPLAGCSLRDCYMSGEVVAFSGMPKLREPCNNFSRCPRQLEQDDFGQVCSVLEISLIVKVCLPVQGFGVGAAAVGSTISVYAIARLMMNLPAGILADRYGRKPLLVWGPLITAIGPGRYSVLAYRSTWSI